MSEGEEISDDGAFIIGKKKRKNESSWKGSDNLKKMLGKIHVDIVQGKYSGPVVRAVGAERDTVILFSEELHVAPRTDNVGGISEYTEFVKMLKENIPLKPGIYEEPMSGSVGMLSYYTDVGYWDKEKGRIDASRHYKIENYVMSLDDIYSYENTDDMSRAVANASVLRELEELGHKGNIKIVLNTTIYAYPCQDVAHENYSNPSWIRQVDCSNTSCDSRVDCEYRE